jgi:hypothetical protein
MMNRRLEEAIARVEALPDDRQSEAAEVLFAFLDTHVGDIQLTPAQIAEVERRMSDDEPFATDEEVRSTFVRLSARPARRNPS